MKRGIVFVTLGVTLAGVASANVFTANPPSVAPQPQAREAGSAKSTMVPPELPVRSSPKATAAEPVVKKASVETRQAPVPLQVKPRAPVNRPVAPDDRATEAKASESATQQEAAAGGDTLGEKAAKAAIEADGYKGVTVLRKGVNGVWHASALRGKTTVMLTVDASGAVAAE